MARRKGISTNKSRAAVTRKPLQEAAQQCAADNHEDPGGGISSRPLSQGPLAMDHSINNNNDHKYLHKKFKRVASVAPSDHVDQVPLPEHKPTSDNYEPPRPVGLGSRPNQTESVGTSSSSGDLNAAGPATCTTASPTVGRYVCPYCKLSCAKPSVLQKHIRAHTNERPYPCGPCGFAFKTKSNLYKHRRSRAHGLRLQGAEILPETGEDDWSLGSDPEVSSNASVNSEPPAFGLEYVINSRNTSPTETSAESTERSTPPSLSSSTSSQPPKDTRTKTIYKPKFHKASLYHEEDSSNTKAGPMSANTDFLNKHISKIISENEAIVDDLDLPLQKRYSKIANMQRQLIVGENSSSKLALALLKNDQPLNLTKLSDSDSSGRKRCFSESFAHIEATKVSQHPQNPEGSIIKDLLLKARAHLLTPNDGSDADAVHVCPLCRIPYRSADNLEVHTLYYCKGAPGNGPHSAPISPIGSPNHAPKFQKPDNLYFRSNSINVNLPETYNPNTLAKLASSTLRVPASSGPMTSPISLAKLATTTLRPNARFFKPENLYISHSSKEGSPLRATRREVVASPLPSPGPLLGNTRLVDAYNIVKNSQETFKQNEDMKINRSTPSPASRRELDNRVAGGFSQTKNELLRTPVRREELSPRHVDNVTPVSKIQIHSNESYSPPIKKSRMECIPTTLRSLEELCLSPMSMRQNSLQMFGGEVRIVDNTGESKTMRIEPSRSQNSPTMLPSNLHSPKPAAVAQETSNIVVRSGLHSGGTIVHNPPTPKEVLPSPSPVTPKMLVSIAPNINTPNLAVAGIPAPSMAHFQFPPLNSITAYNPLTLPPVSPGSAATIMHGGKLIPYVPGMPGPNTLSAVNNLGFKNSVGRSESPHRDMPGTPKSLGLNLSSPSRERIPSPQYIPANIPARASPNHRNVPSPLALNPSIVNSAQTSPNSMAINFMRNNPGSMTTNTPSVMMSSKVTSMSIPSIKIESTEDVFKMKLHPPSSPGGHKLNLLNGVGHTRHKIEDLIWKVEHTATKDIWSPGSNFAKHRNGEKSFNFTRMADNVSPRKSEIPNGLSISPPRPRTKSPNKFPAKETNEIRHFNFENLISKSEILNKSLEITSTSNCDVNTDIISSSNVSLKMSDSTSTTSERTSETSYFKKNMDQINNSTPDNRSKFLRPSSLPLKPGTFTPKRHHGITPNANTLPLISPETPRPAKAYGQLYLNGHAYTYLGLKCSTRLYYCTLNRPQPTYVANQHQLSMYSQWKVHSKVDPNPLGLTPDKVMAHYDSRHRPQRYSIAGAGRKSLDHVTHSSQPKTQTDNVDKPSNSNRLSSAGDEGEVKTSANLAGGFESNEEYTYVRGRGRGRYVCSECGIRCKKPSMLKKHIRTHTDVRPFTCRHCAFSFKTKGNLTKHMKSKAHYKKCVEMGISPVPTSVEDGDFGDGGDNSGVTNIPGDSSSDSDSDGDDGNEGETESSDTDESKSRLPEQEAAESLLFLSGSRANTNVISTITPGLVSWSRPCTYPYSALTNSSTMIPRELVSKSNSVLVINSDDDTTSHSGVNTSTTEQTPVTDVPNKRSDYYSRPVHVLEISVPNNLPAARQNSVIMSSHSQQPNRNVCYVSEESQSYQPMDLTKPRSREKPYSRNVVVPILNQGSEQANHSLVTRSAKVPQFNSKRATGEPMLQVYITERGLQDVGMKQSQLAINKVKLVETTKTSGQNTSRNEGMDATQGHVSMNLSNAPKQLCITTNNVIYSRAIPNPVIETTLHNSEFNEPENSLQVPVDNESETSGMETLAEIAANSSKLDTTESSLNRNCLDMMTNSPKSATDNAKIVASEYLKMASGKSKLSDNFDGSIQNDITEDSGLSSEGHVKPLEIMKHGELVNDVTSEQADKPVARKVVVGAGGVGFKMASTSNDFPSAATFATGRLTEDGRSICVVCNKTFSKPSQLRLHINIHYFERPFRCEACAVSFRTKGHLQKHERSVSHHNKVSMTSTFGAPTTSNPRPFKCLDCKIAFRIHGHLAKHLRSKMHVMRLECLGKLPFGTYAEIERAGVSLTDIDTTDCDNSLASLQILAQKLHEKDPTKLGAWDPETMAPPLLPAGGESDSDEGEPLSPQFSGDELGSRRLSENSEYGANECHSCRASFATISELNMHTYLEHNNVHRTMDTLNDLTASENKRKNTETESVSESDDKRLKLAES